MTKQFYHTLLLIALTTAVFGQSVPDVYHGFEDSSVWRVDYEYHNPYQFPCSIDYSFQYYFDGDTTINSLLHKKLYRSSVQTDTVSCPDLSGLWADAPVSGYMGALLEDSVANRTYFVFENSSIDSLLFDYNMVIGDTLRGCLPHSFFYSDAVTVTSVDSVEVNGDYRKRWGFSPVNLPWNVEPFIIQGVGSNMGLFDPINTYAIDFTERYLICYLEGEEVVFSTDHSSTQGCSLVNVSDLPETSILSVYPNPTTGHVRLDFGKTNSDFTLQIITPLGSLMHSERVSGIHYTDIELPETNGLYFIQLLNSDGKRSVLKVIKE